MTTLDTDKLREAKRALSKGKVPEDAWAFIALPCGHSVMLPRDPNKTGFIDGDPQTPLQPCCIKALREMYED